MQQFRLFFGSGNAVTLDDLKNEATDYGIDWHRFYNDFDPGNEATQYMVLYGLNGAQHRLANGMLQGIDLKNAAYYFPKSVMWATGNPTGVLQIVQIWNRAGKFLFERGSNVIPNWLYYPVRIII